MKRGGGQKAWLGDTFRPLDGRVPLIPRGQNLRMCHLLPAAASIALGAVISLAGCKNAWLTPMHLPHLLWCLFTVSFHLLAQIWVHIGALGYGIISRCFICVAESRVTPLHTWPCFSILFLAHSRFPSPCKSSLSTVNKSSLIFWLKWSLPLLIICTSFWFLCICISLSENHVVGISISNPPTLWHEAFYWHQSLGS